VFTSLPESPQGVGDLVGLACRLVRANIKLIWNFLLIPTVFATGAGILFQWVFTYGAANVASTKDIGTAFGLAGIWLVGFSVFMVAWWILALRLLALVRVILKFSPTLDEATAYMYRRKWAVLGIYFASFALLLGGIFASVAVMASGMLLSGQGPSLATALSVTLGGVLMTGIIVLYLLVSHMALCMLACEDEPVMAIIGRSANMVLRHFWRSVAFGLVFAVTFTVVSYPMSLPVAVLTFSDAMQHGLGGGGPEGPFSGGYKPPLYILVLAQTWESVMGMYLRPFVVFAFGLFYFDLRLRSEGLDIRRKLQSMLSEVA